MKEIKQNDSCHPTRRQDNPAENVPQLQTRSNAPLTLNSALGQEVLSNSHNHPMSTVSFVDRTQNASRSIETDRASRLGNQTNSQLPSSPSSAPAPRHQSLTTRETELVAGPEANVSNQEVTGNPSARHKRILDVLQAALDLID
jgi:hypothetical protein